jgi:hypothetical protein
VPEQRVARFVHDLATRIAERWAMVDHVSSAFAEIAGTALRELSPSDFPTRSELVQWALDVERLPEQYDVEAAFGQPPLNLYADERFVVTALFWLDGTTTVHQHAFSGAFRVLEGSSIHTRFEFSKRHQVCERLLVGGLDASTTEVLELGQVREIAAGSRFIHSLFHLDRPSLTLLARTRHGAAESPQYSYLPPFVALDPFEKDPTVARRIQLLAVLHATERDGWSSAARGLLERFDAETAFHVLRHVRKAGERSLFAECAELVRLRHGELGDAFVASIEEERRRAELAELRGRIVDPELRYFLGLLMNLRTRDEMFRLTSARFPQVAPVETSLRWLSGLGSVRFAVQAGPATFEVSAAGIPIDESTLAVARLLLEGVPPAVVGDRLAGTRIAPGVELSRERVVSCCRALVELPLLRPLFGVREP